jgi:pimeloyl-ACP methyl ester carboxylesterase
MTSTQLILLPGMDGTGDLFAPLVECLPTHINAQVIPLPTCGAQDYETLADHVAAQLPDRPFFLLGESFSGPIAAILAARYLDRIQGIVFAASFLTPIQHPLVILKELTPIHQLLRLPGSNIALRFLMLGPRADSILIDTVRRAILKAPRQYLQQRIHAVQTLNLPTVPTGRHALYIGANHDRLVGPKYAEAVKSQFPKLQIKWLDGPHLILQSKPTECARLITEFCIKNL